MAKGSRLKIYQGQFEFCLICDDATSGIWRPWNQTAIVRLCCYFAKPAEQFLKGSIEHDRSLEHVNNFEHESSLEHETGQGHETRSNMIHFKILI